MLKLGANLPLLLIGGVCFAVVVYLYRELHATKAALRAATDSPTGGPEEVPATEPDAVPDAVMRRRVRFADAGDATGPEPKLGAPGGADRGTIRSQPARRDDPSTAGPAVGPRASAAAASTPAAFESGK
jgi:hypothetical protein